MDNNKPCEMSSYALLELRWVMGGTQQSTRIRKRARVSIMRVSSVFSDYCWFNARRSGETSSTRR